MFDRPLPRLSPRTRAAIHAARTSGMPADVLALYSRWWQLETWLRSLVYVELRAKFGPTWADHLDPQATRRKTKDQHREYMAGPDAEARLAYLDVTPLFALLESHWDLFGPALIAKEAWSGRAVELREIRHRIGHCRRPHADDLNRLEQILRDLEPGARRAARAFNIRETPDRSSKDPLVQAWVPGRDQYAHIIEHAQRQYETRFRLQWSRRPWAASQPGAPITGQAGYLWHATWTSRGALIDLRELWEDEDLEEHRDLIVFVSTSNLARIDLSFSALEDPETAIEAIDQWFQSVLHCVSISDPDEWAKWEPPPDRDFRVQFRTPWTQIDDGPASFPIFDAGPPTRR